MRDGTLITIGFIGAGVAAVCGAGVAAVCCFTPLLAIVFGAVGLTASLAKVDHVLIPALILCVAAIAFGLFRLRPRQGENATILESVITCPRCGMAKRETMPIDACRIFYTCSGCGAQLRPKPGNCCVFCSYGSAPCPPFAKKPVGVA
jgi:Membrane transport protein MerF